MYFIDIIKPILQLKFGSVHLTERDRVDGTIN